MLGQTPSVTSPWYTEPLRRIGTYTAITAGVVTAVIAVLNQADVLDIVPAHYRTGVTLTIAFLGAVSVALHKLQAWLARNGVPGTTFNGMLSPQHTHEAMIASAQPTPLTTGLPGHVDKLAADLDAAQPVDPEAI